MNHAIVEHTESGWKAEFAIDMAKAPAGCKESLDFFGDPVTREDESDESTVKAFIQFWAPTLMVESIEHGSPRGDPLRMIKAMSEREGIIPLDGSAGIRLLYCDHYSVDSFDFEIKTN